MAEALSPTSVALRRFGLCGRPAEAALIRGDPKAWLLQQIGTPVAASPGMPDTIQSLRNYVGRRDAQQARSGRSAAMPSSKRPAAVMEAAPALARLQQSELVHVLAAAMSTANPLHERLALFWLNHFTVAGQRGVTATLTGAFERDAVRSRMLGNFSDLLLAAALHPAMLFYLDNVSSVGRNAPDKRGAARGVNENLAREILELHSLGADGGYTQEDVTVFANALSGWTVRLPTGRDTDKIGTIFNPRMHEPGAKRILGKTYPDSGAEQAPAVLRDLAKHPSTARNIARRLSLHFVGETCPPALPAQLEAAFRDSEGDLTAVTRALVDSGVAWQAPHAKLRLPLEFVMAASRVLQRMPAENRLLPLLRALGQPFFLAPSPRGWDEADNAWASADGIKTRLDWASEFAAGVAHRYNPAKLAEQAVGPSISAASQREIARAATIEQGITLLLMSPELQRR
jgi:uncharacterized protein (DUF1800 family)